MTGNLTYSIYAWTTYCERFFFLEWNHYDRSWTYVDYRVSNNKKELSVRTSFAIQHIFYHILKTSFNQ